MNILLKLFIISTLFCFYQIDAQYVVKKDTLSGTELSFALDERVNDALEKIEDNCNRNSGAPVKTPTKVLVANRELTNAEICRKFVLPGQKPQNSINANHFGNHFSPE